MTRNQPSVPVQGLRSDIVPSFGARLVQEGCRLHFLADRASLCGDFTAEQLHTLDITFPQFVKQLESALKNGALDPRQSHRHSITLNGLTCEADTDGSHGYVYLTIYPTE
ncbi:antitoxin YeeU [Salmonella enterica subsp. enterica serovar Sarajane]|nr:antitoxin YeeU [Salmonella enterica subsp. enterica serovar Sarajane]